MKSLKCGYPSFNLADELAPESVCLLVKKCTVSIYTKEKTTEKDNKVKRHRQEETRRVHVEKKEQAEQRQV